MRRVADPPGTPVRASASAAWPPSNRNRGRLHFGTVAGIKSVCLAGMRRNSQTGRSRESAIDGRTTRHEGYGISQSRRAMIECIFGWGKQHGTMRKTKHRGIRGVTADFMLNLIAYNLIRIPKLLAA